MGGCASGSAFRLCFCCSVGLTVQKKLIFIHRTDSHNPRMKAEVASYILPTHVEMNLWLQHNLRSTQPTSMLTIDEWHSKNSLYDLWVHLWPLGMSKQWKLASHHHTFELSVWECVAVQTRLQRRQALFGVYTMLLTTGFIMARIIYQYL